MAPNTTTTIRMNTPVPPCGVLPGAVLARRYRLDAVMGWGGQAVVFHATDLSAGGTAAPCAVKVVRTDLPSDAYQDAATALRWEAHLLRRLRHPALLRVRHFAVDAVGTWLARDVAHGTPLAQLGVCSPPLVTTWLLELCDLLDYLHTQSPPVICCDLKPANLVLQPNGRLALIDLGAAQTHTQRPQRRPRPRYGTPGYASPEQLGNWGTDERADLFSLAVVAYELLTGTDPTAAPLQFDLTRLDALDVRLAHALRLALALEPGERLPTVAVLRALLTAPDRPAPLLLEHGVEVVNQQDLLDMVQRHPALLEKAWREGALVRWLAAHPDAMLGRLLHDLRAAQRAASARQPFIDTFLDALAPVEGSPTLHARPAALEFGALPLRHWRLWSGPHALTLCNTASHPVRWELVCPAQRSGEVRIAAGERMLRRQQGILAPGGQVELALVAAGSTGPQRGALTLRSGTYEMLLPWRGEAQAGVPVGQQVAASLDELDLNAPELLSALEAALRRGVLPRWLRKQGLRTLAREVAAVAQPAALGSLEARLLVLRVLHTRAPQRFPRLHVAGEIPTMLELLVGEELVYALTLENHGPHPCSVALVSYCPWAQVMQEEGRVIDAGGRLTCLVALLPPPGTPPGPHELALELWTGNAVVPLPLPVTVIERRWWRRALDWLRRTI